MVNTAAYHESNIATEVSQKYRSQAIIISIHYRWSDGEPRLSMCSGPKEGNVTMSKHLENIAGRRA